MKTILFTLLLFLGIVFQGNTQEFIIESDATATVFNPDNFQSEVTHIQVYMDMVIIRWNEAGTGGTFQASTYLQTESGDRIVTHTISNPIFVLDLINQGTSVHTYVRNQIYNAVIGVDPFGLTVWNKQY